MKNAPQNKLVVIDYSTTWCGPCKIAFPKFVAMSQTYPEVLFLKCVGDKGPGSSAVFKQEGVRSVPAFHFWKNGARVETVSGGRMDDIEATIKSMK